MTKPSEILRGVVTRLREEATATRVNEKELRKRLVDLQQQLDAQVQIGYDKDVAADIMEDWLNARLPYSDGEPLRPHARRGP